MRIPITLDSLERDYGQRRDNSNLLEGCECPTIQEHYIAHILDSLERDYQLRVPVTIDKIDDGDEGSFKYYYTWDVFLGPEVGLVIQADGANGHGTKYSLSDDLFQCSRFDFIKNILHVEVETEEEIRELIIKALSNMTDS
jgi:hypothetical protein